MARLVLNRDGGKTDEFGHLLGLSRFLMGEVIEGLVVSAQASPNMTVQVSSGSAKIPYGTGGTRYDYWVASDAVEPVTIATADPANPRIDYIIATVIRTVVPNTTVTNNSNNMLRFISVAGTPAAAPTAPNAAAMQAAAGTGNPYIILRRINVGAGITQVTSAQIGLDLRTMTYSSRAAIADGQITTDMLAPLAVTNAKIANTAVKSQNIDFTTFGTGNYSLEEKNTGFRWIDGKAIFRKTVNIGSLPNATFKEVAHGVVGIDRIINLEASYSSGVDFFSSNTTRDSIASQIGTWANRTNIAVWAGNNRTPYSGYVTIEYTKL